MAVITYYGDLRTLTGKGEECIPADTLPELIGQIQTLYGKAASKAARASLIVVDNEKVLRIRQTKLLPDSKVGFFPLCCGG